MVSEAPMEYTGREMFGCLNVNKPAGPTSHDVVAAIRRRVGRGVKVGHAGTLDPFAEGVLVLCLGPATRLAEYIQAQPKRYRAELTLGATSTTDDPQGRIEPSLPADPPNEAQLRRALERFVGRIEQIPPAHSAVHVTGWRAYELARAGREVELTARWVFIHSLELIEWAYPRVLIDVRCGSGTYLRALARDIGRELGTGAYCSALTRTAVGPFALASARPPERIDPHRDLLSPLLTVADLPKRTLPPTAIRRLALGQAVALDEPAEETLLAVLDDEGKLVALGRAFAQGRRLRPEKVFPRADSSS